MDTFFTRMFQTREGLTNAESVAATDMPKTGSFGNQAVQINSSKAALSIAAFQRAIVLRANTMSQLLMQYQRFDISKGSYVLDMETRGGCIGGRINYLLQVRPNPLMSAPVMFRQAQMNVDLEGNAVIYIERNSQYEPKAFWLCSSASVNLVTYKYSITYKAPGGNISLTNVDAIDVIHLRGPLSQDNGLTGLSLLTYGRKCLELAATNDKLVMDNASKGGKLKLLVQEDKKEGSFGLGRVKKSELEKITTKLNDDIYENDVVLLNNIANVTPISQSLQQQEVQSSRQFSVKEIARITGVPPILLMDDSNSSYKSPEAATQEFLLRTISPMIRENEAEWNSKLLGPEGYGVHRLHLCEKPLLRLDPVATANVAKIQLECGIKTVNELRAENDMPAIKGGDKALVSTNLQDVENLKVTGNTNAGTPAEEGGTEA